MPKAKTPAERKRAPMTFYSPETGEAICEAVASGGSVKAWCEANGMEKKTVMRWLAANPDFQEAMARARFAQADAFVDDIIHIADTEDDPQRAKNRIAVRQWVASKTNAVKYGDRVDHTMKAHLMVQVVRFGEEPAQIEDGSQGEP